eukprot:365702-Chlamydomonas_euryale.AAC.5
MASWPWLVMCEVRLQKVPQWHGAKGCAMARCEGSRNGTVQKVAHWHGAEASYLKPYVLDAVSTQEGGEGAHHCQEGHASLSPDGLGQPSLQHRGKRRVTIHAELCISLPQPANKSRFIANRPHDKTSTHRLTSTSIWSGT